MTGTQEIQKLQSLRNQVNFNKLLDLFEKTYGIGENEIQIFDMFNYPENNCTVVISLIGKDFNNPDRALITEIPFEEYEIMSTIDATPELERIFQMRNEKNHELYK